MSLLHPSHPLVLKAIVSASTEKMLVDSLFGLSCLHFVLEIRFPPPPTPPPQPSGEHINLILESSGSEDSLSPRSRGSHKELRGSEQKGLGDGGGGGPGGEGAPGNRGERGKTVSSEMK